MAMPERIDTIVIGAGQAGLSAGYHLTQAGREHVVLERGVVADSWRNRRWDGFYLNTPKFTQQLPGFEYDGPEPEAFSSRDETIAYLGDYAASFSAPVRTGVEVTALRHDGSELEVDADGETLRARNVVVATGAYQSPTPTALAQQLPEDIFHLQTDDYRRPEQLPDGAVLVVGGGQSGCQISDELRLAGRSVYLSVGRCPWLPRRYRGREIIHWLVESGYMDQTVDTLPSPALRLLCNPPISGNDGGHDCHPRWLGARGVTLLGRLTGVAGHTLTLAPDLEESFAFGDELQARVFGAIETHIAEAAVDAGEREPGEPFPEVHTIERLDLREAGISTVLWATGYRPAFGWIDLPLFDDVGWPVQRRGVTETPGLYFLGLHWLHTRRSSLLFGVGDDAEHVVSHLVGRAGG
jgi:putative flavoprotein involved in K+ transport